MIAGDDAIVQIHDIFQLRTHVLVFIVAGRLEGAVGQYQVTFLAQRLEGIDQFRIVELVQRSENLAAIILNILKQRQKLRTQQAAQRDPQLIAGVPMISAIFGFLPSLASARDPHCADTIPLLKYAATFGVAWPVIVIGGVNALASAGESLMWSLSGPTTGTTEYCTSSPGDT